MPAVNGQEAGYTLDRLPVHHGATQRQPCILALTARVNLEMPINLTCMHLGGGMKPEYPERTCTPHTERPQSGFEPATLLLTTTSLCSL